MSLVCSSDLVTNHDTETTFAVRLVVSLKEGWVLKGVVAALRSPNVMFKSTRVRKNTYCASETLPTPLSSKRLHGPDPVPNALFTFLTLWHPQSHMTGLAVRVPSIYRKAYIIVSPFECSVSSETSASRTRRKEGVATFGAEKVLFVVGTFAELGIIEGDEDLVDDGSLTVVASWSELL